MVADSRSDSDAAYAPSIEAAATPGAGDDEAGQLRRRRKQRLEMLFMVAASYSIDVLLMLALCVSGALNLTVPLVYGSIALLINALFYVILGSAWTERFRDHYIALPYMIVHSAVNVLFLVWVPEIGVLMLMVLFVIFAFAALRMNFSRMLLASFVIALVVGLVMAAHGPALTLPMATWQQRFISGLWFALILVRISLLGLFGSQLRATLAKRNKQLAETFARLDELATRDELTGVLNRRAIMELLEQERQRQARTGNAFAVALLDIDHFKQINDRYGHLTGDQVLRTFARAVGGSMRNTDRLGRYGGEEFLVLFTATTGEDLATRASERIRGAVIGQDWSALTPGEPVTVSVGVAVSQSEESAELLLSRADSALYRAKHQGRNCVRIGKPGDLPNPPSVSTAPATGPASHA